MRTSRLAAFAAMACACAALCGAAPQHPSMAVTHGNHGEVSIAVDGVTWLSSNRTALTVGDRQLSSADGSLVLQSSSKASGTDGIGPFEATTWSWVPTTHRPAVEAGSVVLTTTVRTYSSDVVVFEQSFPYGVPSVSSHNFIASDFPYFLVNEVDDALPTLSSAAFGGTFATSTGKWVGSGLQQCSASEQAGPILLYAADASNFPTLVTSPLTSVKTGDIYCTGHLSFGVKGTLTSIPAGYTLSFVMSLGSGPKRAMEAWGDALLAYSGKEARADLYGDAIRSTLGFWTDNGGWFHYPGFTQPGEYKAKLQQAVEAYNASGIPVGHWQGDSWWYPKGSGGTGSSQNGGYGAYRWVVSRPVPLCVCCSIVAQYPRTRVRMPTRRWTHSCSVMASPWPTGRPTWECPSSCTTAGLTRRIGTKRTALRGSGRGTTSATYPTILPRSTSTSSPSNSHGE